MSEHDGPLEETSWYKSHIPDVNIALNPRLPQLIMSNVILKSFNRFATFLWSFCFKLAGQCCVDFPRVLTWQLTVDLRTECLNLRKSADFSMGLAMALPVQNCWVPKLVHFSNYVRRHSYHGLEGSCLPVGMMRLPYCSNPDIPFWGPGNDFGTDLKSAKQ